MDKLGLATPDPALRRRIAGLNLTALTFCRPGGGAKLRRMDFTVVEGSWAAAVAAAAAVNPLGRRPQKPKGAWSLALAGE